MNRFTYRGTNTPPELRTPHSHPTEANGTRSRMDTRALTARSGRLYEPLHLPRHQHAA